MSANLGFPRDGWFSQSGERHGIGNHTVFQINPHSVGQEQLHACPGSKGMGNELHQMRKWQDSESTCRHHEKYNLPL